MARGIMANTKFACNMYSIRFTIRCVGGGWEEDYSPMFLSYAVACSGDERVRILLNCTNAVDSFDLIYFVTGFVSRRGLFIVDDRLWGRLVRLVMRGCVHPCRYWLDG